MKPYPAYKDSGVLWLGDVPAHWALIPNRMLVRQRKHLVGQRHAEFQLLSLTKQGVIIRDLSVLKGKFSADMGTSQEVLPGDLVFCLFDVPETPRTVGLSRYHGMITGAYTVFETVGSCSKEFFEAFYTAMDDQKLLSPLYSGLRNTIPPSVFLHTKTPVPPLPEQHAIVRYLDHVDRRIRRYIRARQQLIKLLEEQKQAIIHSAVTGQIDVRTGQPYPAYKPSGMAWLGDVPAHWEVRRSKRLFLPRTELALPADIQLSATQAYGVISQEEYERRVGRKVVKIFRHLEKRRHVEIDDFVISMRSFQGGLERAWERGCIRSSYVVLKPSQSLCVPYFAQLFKSSGYIGALQATANFIRDGQDLNYSNFCAVDLPWPPLGEQEQIAAALDSALVALVKTAQRSEREIALLREYRTRLIADVVTGKLDVRAVAATLPDETDEPEPLDDAGALAEDDEDTTGDDPGAAPEEIDA